MNNSNEEIKVMLQFFHDKSIDGEISQQLADRLKELWNKYKKSEINPGDVIICVEAGKFGHYTVRTVESCKQGALQYDRNKDEYITLTASREETVLWTDYSKTQPYNRQAPFYVGHDFSRLQLVIDTGVYREFKTPTYSSTRVSFGIRAFEYYEGWNFARFDLCLKAEHEQEYLLQVRALLGKN